MANRCECPSGGSGVPDSWYSEEELASGGNNHEANECPSTVGLRLYIRKGKDIYLCSCCNLWGDTPKDVENEA